jgi:hypothetical protein
MRTRVAVCLGVALAVAWSAALVPGAAGPAMGAEGEPGQPEIVNVRKIWDAAPHNAFTDLVFHNDEWFCVFREGLDHVSSDGVLRVISSRDGSRWRSASVLIHHGSDLRDAKLTVTPEGKLMLSGAAALHDSDPVAHQTLAWFSDNGRRWSEPVPIGDPNFWLWRVTWRGPRAYGVGYATRGPQIARLYQSGDGRRFDAVVPTFFAEGYPNEHSMVFLEDGTAYCLLRRDGTPSSAQFGIARPPYTDWQWKDLGVRIGGPHMLRLPDGRLVAGVRLMDGKTRTALCWVDPEAGRLTEFLSLPSGGDTSYPGLVWNDGLLWVSYYASHEGKTSIYLARVKIP